MVKVFRPRKAETVVHVDQTDADRKKYNKEFREQKEYEREVKDKRFAKIFRRRKNRGGGGGINIEVTGDSD